MGVRGGGESRVLGRVLLAQTSFLGDVVLTTALAKTIEAALPETEVFWLVRPQAAPLLEPTYGDRVLRFDKRGTESGMGGVVEMARRLSTLGFDAAIGVQRSLRTAAVLAGARIPIRVGFAGSAGSWLYHRRIEKEGAHARDRLVHLARGLGIEARGEGVAPHLDVAPESSRRVAARLEEAGAAPDAGLVVVAPGSAWATKQWPAAHFGAAAAGLCRPGRDRVVVIGTPADRAGAEEIARLVVAAGGSTIDATGGTTISDAVAWIDRARVVLANDSAPAHIAAALGRPVVTMFGPTVPAMGFAPIGPRVRIAERTLDCRPCSRHGGDTCPIGTHECMVDLSVADVVSTAKSLLSDETTEGPS